MTNIDDFVSDLRELANRILLLAASMERYQLAASTDALDDLALAHRAVEELTVSRARQTIFNLEQPVRDGWDILLELFVNHVATSVSRMPQPQPTASYSSGRERRWIALLKERGLLKFRDHSAFPALMTPMLSEKGLATVRSVLSVKTLEGTDLQSLMPDISTIPSIGS